MTKSLGTIGCCLVAALTIQIGGAFQTNVHVVTTTTTTHRTEGTTTRTTKSFFPLFSTQIPPSSSVLEGKLSILQDVVKEMDARHKQLLEQSENAEKDFCQQLETLRTDIEDAQKTAHFKEETIQSLQTDLQELEERHADALKRLKSTMDQDQEDLSKELSALSDERLEKVKKEYSEYVSRLQSQLESKENERQELEDRLQVTDKAHMATIKGLESKIAHLEANLEIEKTNQIKEETLDGQKEKIAALQRDYEESLERLETERFKADELEALDERRRATIQELEGQIHQLSLEKDKFSADLESMSIQSEERVEIAAAAVKAGEKREEKLRDEADRLEQQLRQSQVQARILRLAMNGFVDENKEYEDQRDELWGETEQLETKLQQAMSRIVELEKENQRTLWQRVKAKFSKKPQR